MSSRGNRPLLLQENINSYWTITGILFFFLNKNSVFLKVSIILPMKRPKMMCTLFKKHDFSWSIRSNAAHLKVYIIFPVY